MKDGKSFINIFAIAEFSEPTKYGRKKVFSQLHAHLSKPRDFENKATVPLSVLSSLADIYVKLHLNRRKIWIFRVVKLGLKMEFV